MATGVVHITSAKAANCVHFFFKKCIQFAVKRNEKRYIFDFMLHVFKEQLNLDSVSNIHVCITVRTSN